MKRPILLVLLLAAAYTASAQAKTRGTITGRVLDAATKQPMMDATVTLFSRGDTSTIAFSAVDKQGRFELKNIMQGNFLIGFSYIGYSDILQAVSLTPAYTDVNIGTVYLQRDTGLLQGVVITAAPITITKDTIQFRAGAFKTKINGTLEDMLKKIPGMEVDKDGNITHNGEKITKIYVEGKEFFSNDPKLASQNLTADMIESVQVFDDMSDQARFTKIDDGSRQRAINIKLKKDRKKGIFGRFNAGAGSSERYAVNGSFNSFNNKNQLSVLGGANNVNKLGFTSADAGGAAGSSSIESTRRNAGGGGGSPDGNTESWNTGINYRDSWGPKVLFSGNYFVSNVNTINKTTSYTQNIFSNDSTTYTNDSAYSKNTNLAHRFNTRLEYTIDSANSILATPIFSTPKTPKPQRR